MSRLSKQKLRERIIKRLRKMKADLTQTITDVESWNENNWESTPFDAGWEKSLLHCVTNELAAWENEDVAGVRYWGGRTLKIADFREGENP